MSKIPNSKEGYVKVPGGKVWYKIFGANKKKTPILMIHGGPGFPSNALRILKNLSTERPVIYYDQLGCGKSERPTDKQLWKLPRFLDELKIVRETLDLKKLHILGHSWGSLLAVEHAFSEPKGIKSLIFAGPLLSEPRWTADANKLKSKLPRRTQKIIEKYESKGLFESKEYQKAILEFYKRHYCRIYPYPEPVKQGRKKANLDVYMKMWGPEEFSCTGNLKGHDVTDKLPNINIPTLLTCGRYDEATPETVRYFTDLLPNAEMDVFEKSDHLPHIEEPEGYLKTIRKFLNEQD